MRTDLMPVGDGLRQAKHRELRAGDARHDVVALRGLVVFADAR